MKICLLGSPVELCREFAKTLGIKFFDTEYLNTVGCEFSSIKKQVDNKTVLSQLWIMNPSSRFRESRSLYFRATLAVLILFDTQDRQSFQSAEQFLKEVRKNVISSVSIALVGIQSDTAMSTTEECKTLADKYKTHYYETTTNDSQQINHILTELIRQVLGRWGGKF
jgi:Rab family protein